MKPVVRPATRADIDRYFGEGKVGFTITALVGYVGDEPVGIGGLAHMNGLVCAFFDIKPEGRPYRATIFRACKQVMERARKAGHRYIYATCDKSEPMAPKLLSHLGFEPVDEDGSTWRWSA